MEMNEATMEVNSRTFRVNYSELENSVIAFFFEDRTGYTEARIFQDFPQQKFHKVIVEGNVSVQIADDFVREVFHAFEAGVERMHLGREVALFSLRPLNHLDPCMVFEVTAYNGCGLVCRPVVHDYPFERQNRLMNH